MQTNLSFVLHVFGLVEPFPNNLEIIIIHTQWEYNRYMKRREMKTGEWIDGESWDENEVTSPALWAAATADARNSESESTVEFQSMEFATNQWVIQVWEREREKESGSYHC